MLPHTISLPLSLLDRFPAAPTDGPRALTLDVSVPSSLFIQASDGAMVCLPAAESALGLLEAGIPAPEPITLGVTRFRHADGRDIVVCSELAENQGMSVTNAWPQLATALVRELKLDPAKTTFVEHYHPGSYATSMIDGVKKDTFDRVELSWNNGRAEMLGWRRVAA